MLRRPGSAAAILLPWVFGFLVNQLALLPLGGLAMAVGLVLMVAQPATWVLVLFAAFACGIVALVGLQSFLVIIALSVRGSRGSQVWLRPHGWIDTERRARAPGPIRVTGRPGCRMVACVGSREVLVAVPSVRGPWTYEAMSWYVETLAEMWQQPLDDQRDSDGWEAWMTDPDVRAASWFERKLDDNYYRFRKFHEVRAVQPEAKHDLHGASYLIRKPALFVQGVSLTFTATTVTRGDLVVPLVDIARVYMLYSQNDKNSSQCELNLLMMDGTVQPLFQTTFGNGDLATCGPFNALPALLENHIAEARAPEPADAQSEVPAALRALTKGRVGE